MKLLAYQIAGQTIGIDIPIWTNDILSGNTAFIAIADTGSTPTDYVDISSLTNWDNFGGFTTLTDNEIKEELTKLIPTDPTPEEIATLESWGIFIDTSFLSGQTGTFWGDFRVEGKLWVETIRRVKQEANQSIVRVDQTSGLGGGNIAGLVILNPTGATTGYTSVDDIPYYIVGVDKDGVLVAGWSGDTQPVMRGSSPVYGTQFQLAESNNSSTSTATTPQTKVSMTTTNLPAGKYKIFAKWRFLHTSASSSALFDITLNGTAIGTQTPFSVEPKDVTNVSSLSATAYVNISGVNTILLRYWNELNSTTISDASIELIRVS